MSGDSRSGAIVLFDGVCNLCNSTVQFIISRDRAEYYRFASLQSVVGQTLIAEHHLFEQPMDAVVLIEDGRCFTRSTAALRIARRLRAPWNFLFVLLIIPRPLRDAVYDWVARNRYRWFGRTDSCPLPSANLSRRFLN